MSLPSKLGNSPESSEPVSGVPNDAQLDFEIDQILYCSLMREPMDDAAIERMAQMAANLNRMDHITGMLMHADGVFVQLIEGPREALNHLWARLLADKRHQGIVQLYHRREVESRACSGWDMRYVKRDDLRALIHEANVEIVAGRKSAWAPAIERMDFLLSNSNWDSFVKHIKQDA
jgi:phosphatidylserine/phosphatidylglycerophosphate/cardiolipin synthase-like enzyme